MTKKECAFAALLMQMAADEFVVHGCNDTDAKMLDSIGLTDEEKVCLVEQYRAYNGDIQECECARVGDFYRIPDFAWMGFFAHLLASEAA